MFVSVNDIIVELQKKKIRCSVVASKRRVKAAKKEFENISINKILELTLAEYFFQDFYIQHIKKLERGTQSYYFHNFSRLAKLDKKTK